MPDASRHCCYSISKSLLRPGYRFTEYRIEPVTLKCVKDSFSRKGLLFAKRTFIFAKRTFVMGKTFYYDYV